MSPQRRPSFAIEPRALSALKSKFREVFPRRFHDPRYLDWERHYKWEAHSLWRELLGREPFDALLRRRAYGEIASRAIAVYARPKLNLLSLYEWMALREAVSDPAGARRFAPALRDLVYGDDPFADRFQQFIDTLDQLPQRVASRLCKWPVATVYPFIALPREHLIVKPNLMKRAAASLGFDLHYASRPNVETYAAVRDLAGRLRSALAAWHPRDMVDIQGFIWVTHSDEYADWPWE